MNIDEKLIEHLLGSDGWLKVNKFISTLFGLKEAIILADLISRRRYFKNNNKLDKEGFFYVPQGDLEKTTTFSPYRQRIPFKNLEKHKVLIIEKRGNPCRNYYKLNYNTLFQLLRNCTTSSGETAQLYNSINKNKNNPFPLQEKGSQTNMDDDITIVSNIDEDGNEITKDKWGNPLKKELGVKKEGKNHIALRIQHRFIAMAFKDVGTSPIMNIEGYKLVLRAMNQSNLSEGQIYELFNDWFASGRSDEELVQITRCLSDVQVNAWKVENQIP